MDQRQIIEAYVEQLSEECASMMCKLVELQQLTKRLANTSRVRDASNKKRKATRQPAVRKEKES